MTTLIATEEPGTYLATSDSNPHDRYVLRGVGTPFPVCNCQAATNGRDCRHAIKAIELAAEELRSEPMPETETPARALVPSNRMELARQRAESVREQLSIVRGGFEDALFIADTTRAMWPEEIAKMQPEQGRKVAALIIQSAVELGVSALQAFSYITVIKGKPFLMARMVNALVSRTSGCFITVTERTSGSCSALARRPGRPDVRVTITIEDAKRAGWIDRNPNYRSNPAAMLTARCITTVGWLQYPDKLAGMDVYDDENGEAITAIEVEDTPASVKVEYIDAEYDVMPDAPESGEMQAGDAVSQAPSEVTGDERGGAAQPTAEPSPAAPSDPPASPDAPGAADWWNDLAAELHELGIRPTHMAKVVAPASWSLTNAIAYCIRKDVGKDGLKRAGADVLAQSGR